MEVSETQWIERYAQKLNEGHGDFNQLSADERKHLRLLMQMFELEGRLVELQGELSQEKMPL